MSASMLNFKRNDASGKDEQQAESSKIIRVDISEIDTSHMNPRKTRGEHYESTKQSIKNIGLQSMLTITRLPNDKHYSLYNGGNTRLAILKELVEEYIAAGENDKANALRWQDCRYVPYTSDLDLLIKHMAENEERSGMTFIDKARAVFKIRELYLQRTGEESVSNNKLVQYIHSLGWTRINRQIITELSFTHDELKTVVPLALEAGMGKPKVNQLRLWLNYIEIYVGHLVETCYCNYSIEQAKHLYFQVLSQHDSNLEPINLDAFFEDFCYQLSDILRSFDPMLTSIRIANEIDYISEHGEVFQEIDPEELTRRLEETTDMPPAVFPTPRKPRSPSVPKVGADDISDNHLPSTEIPTKKTKPEQPTNETPIDSDVELPNENLSYEQYNVEMHLRVHNLCRNFLQKYDHTSALQDVLLFEENNNLIQNPPYSYIDLSDNSKFNALKITLENCSDSERYALLSLIILHDFFARHFVTPPNEISKARLQQLSLEWRQQYNDYQLAYRTGLIYTMYEIPASIIDVEAFNKQLLKIFQSVETSRQESS